MNSSTREYREVDVGQASCLTGQAGSLSYAGAYARPLEFIPAEPLAELLNAHEFSGALRELRELRELILVRKHSRPLAKFA
jgi:hypothetical protein